MSAADFLEEIADLIGAPVETFTNGARAPRDLTGAIELLEIWDAIESDEDREKLLAIGRGLIGM